VRLPHGTEEARVTAADINPWLTLILSVIAIGGFVWTQITSGGAKALKEVHELRRDVEADDKVRSDAIVARFQLVEGRVQTMEGELKHLPDRDMVHGLQLTLKDIQIEMASMRGLTEQATRTSQRVEGWLLQRAEEQGR
jgi:hypothetical protein